MKTNFFYKQLILIGGGHSNIQILKHLCMYEYQGLHTILISNEYYFTYSGMTPGYITNNFSKENVNIDLQKLCFNAGVIFIKDEVIGLKDINKKIFLKKNPPLYFDYLSINSGSISKKIDLKIHEKSNCISVKPISSLLKSITKIDKETYGVNDLNISIIGGGIASYELGFSLKQRYQDKVHISIIGKKLLSEKNINAFSKKQIRKTANNLGIKEIKGSVHEIFEKKIALTNGKNIKSDINLISTGAELAPWLKECSLKKTDSGFMAVNKFLQSHSNKKVFITGDIAEIDGIDRPKSGVMAVRQGQILKKNIFLQIQNKNLLKFKAQKNWLYLIGTYKDKAILNYYFLTFHNQLCWNLKVFIDKLFLKKFFFDSKKIMIKKNIFYKDFKDELSKMYCQGCGSKVSKKNLINYLEKNNQNSHLSDASIVDNGSTKILQTIDHIKHFSSFNPFDFGAISYLHSQNDILSAGGNVTSLSVSLGIPFSKNLTELFYLEYFMKGIESEANSDDALIASGHSYLNNEPGITITMNGNINELDKILEKNMADEDDLIYLSKPLGTGYLLSAYFSNSPEITTTIFESLINWMKTSNKFAYKSAKSSECKAMTDISGFGLASHLSDICKSSNLTANISLKENILINNNLKILRNFISTGYESNYESSAKNVRLSSQNKLEKILYDPQTNGPLLICIKPKNKKNFEENFFNLSKRWPLLIGKFIKKEENLIIVK